MSKKLSKEEVKSPDQVLKTLKQGFQWSQTHSTITVVAALIFIVLGVGYSIFSVYSEKKENQAHEFYAQFEKSYLDKKRGFEEAAREAAQPPKSAKDVNAPTKVKASGDLQKDFGPEVTGFKEVMEKHPSTKAAQMAALNLSEVFMEYKNVDEALQSLQKVEAHSQGKDLISSVVLAQFGNVLTEKGDCKAAIDQWGKVIANKESQFIHDTLRIKSGFCYEKLNDTAKAEELYKKVSQNALSEKDPAAGNFGDSGLGKEAEKYLRLLKLKRGSEAQGS